MILLTRISYSFEIIFIIHVLGMNMYHVKMLQDLLFSYELCWEVIYHALKLINHQWFTDFGNVTY